MTYMRNGFSSGPADVTADGALRRDPLRLPDRPAARPPMHDARELTAGGSEARIVLDGVEYVLRVTRQRKLILTK